MQAPIVLASASPRRRELLQLVEVQFEVMPSEAPEPPFNGEEPVGVYAVALARAKAEWVASRRREGLVLGADTVVTLDGRVFGKPSDAVDAARMLSALSGRTHSVITGVCLIEAGSGRTLSKAVETRVTFRSLTSAQIQRYVGSGEPMDKAGAYAIQGRAAVFVTRIEGCYFNVVGLPVPTVAEMLVDFGCPVL